MITYTVRQGDYLAKIAGDHGFADWKPIWQHARNEALREKRKNPNVLFPGDQLFIPDAERQQLDAQTERKHRFSVERGKLKLLLRFDDQHVGPVAGARCRLEVGDQTFQLVTDAQGRIEQEIAPGAEAGLVVVEDPETPLVEVILPLRIGHLDPVEETSGQSARLNNLGYFAGPFADQTPDEAALSLRSAIEEFQCDDGLVVDGVCGARTQAALKKAHGS